MKNLKFNTVWFLLFISLFFFIFSQKAYAYLDPGTGSYVVQILLASLFGVLFVIKMFWNSIKMFFVKIFRVFSKRKQTIEKNKSN